MGNTEKVKIVVYIEIGLVALQTTTYILCGILYSVLIDKIVEKSTDAKMSEHDIREAAKLFVIIGGVILGIYLLISFILLIFLYKGHKQRSAGKLKVWFIVGSIIEVLVILAIVSSIAKNPGLFVSMIPQIIFAGYRLWALIVVKGLMNEIQAGPPEPPFQAVQYSNA